MESGDVSNLLGIKSKQTHQSKVEVFELTQKQDFPELPIQSLKVLKGEKLSPTCKAFEAKGECFALAEKNQIEIFKNFEEKSYSEENVVQLAFSVDCKLLALLKDSEIKVINIEDGKESQVLSQELQERPITMKWSCNKLYLAFRQKINTYGINGVYSEFEPFLNKYLDVQVFPNSEVVCLRSKKEILLQDTQAIISRVSEEEEIGDFCLVREKCVCYYLKGSRVVKFYNTESKRKDFLQLKSSVDKKLQFFEDQLFIASLEGKRVIVFNLDKSLNILSHIQYSMDYSILDFKVGLKYKEGQKHLQFFVSHSNSVWCYSLKKKFTKNALKETDSSVEDFRELEATQEEETGESEPTQQEELNEPEATQEEEPGESEPTQQEELNELKPTQQKDSCESEPTQKHPSKSKTTQNYSQHQEKAPDSFGTKPEVSNIKNQIDQKFQEIENSIRKVFNEDNIRSIVKKGLLNPTLKPDTKDVLYELLQQQKETLNSLEKLTANTIKQSKLLKNLQKKPRPLETPQTQDTKEELSLSEEKITQNSLEKPYPKNYLGYFDVVNYLVESHKYKEAFKTLLATQDSDKLVLFLLRVNYEFLVSLDSNDLLSLGIWVLHLISEWDFLKGFEWLKEIAERFKPQDPNALSFCQILQDKVDQRFDKVIEILSNKL